jgi:hypothetical protein
MAVKSHLEKNNAQTVKAQILQFNRLVINLVSIEKN